MRTRVKICCITTAGELSLAVRHGADALGFVGPMPSGTGIIPLEEARVLIALAPPSVATFLLSSATDGDQLAAEAQATGASVLQIVDRVESGAYARLRRALPALKLVQVVHVEDLDAIAEARAAAEVVDAVLLDSGTRAGPIACLGGTGRIHDWQISRRIVEGIGKPVILAGGLRPENVAEAVRQVRPYAVDVCTGLRPAGRLDEARLAAFVGAVAEA